MATADQVCACSEPGSVVPAPVELASQNGVVEFTLNFQSAIDAQGLIRHCYVSYTGLEEPTFRVNAGDTHHRLRQPVAGAGSWRGQQQHGRHAYSAR